MEGPRSTLYRTFLLLSLPIVFLLAVIARSSALFGLCLAGAGLLGRARLTARARLRGLGLRREVYPSAFEDEAVSVDLVLENHSARAVHLVEIADRFGPGMADRHQLLEPGPLLARRRRRLRYRTFCSRRWGLYAVGPAVLTTTDAMGLFHAEKAAAEAAPFAVFPRVHEVPALESLGARASLAPQAVSVARPGQSAYYLGVREYRPGDDRRRVHWPATARRGTLYIKEYEVDLTPYLTLFLDLDRRNRAGTGLKSTIEYVVRTAASILWSAARRGDLAQVFAEGAEPLFVPPGQGELHLTHALYELIRARQEGTLPILDLVERYRANLPSGSTAVILSATTALDLARLAEAVEAFRSGAVQPLVLFVDGDSFLPIDRWPTPRAEAEERRREIERFLQERGIPGSILGSEHDLPRELSRPDLLAGRS